MMNTKLFRFAICLVALCVASPRAFADEFGDRTPYYEDDAWYDITEWFDGNDYNPTDEAIGRWDDETFDFTDNATSTDEDNDRSYAYDGYGYRDNTVDSDRWFYDYYDDGYGYWDHDPSWSSYSIYNDANNDGLYDSYSHYYDSDGDGLYENYRYYSFDTETSDDSKTQSTGKSNQKQLQSKPEQINGTVQNTKMVNVRDRFHLVADVKTSDGKTIVVDLGPKRTSAQLIDGDQLTAKGHRVKVGEKTILVATSAQSNNADVAIDRNGRKYQGTVENTRQVSVRGDKNLLAKVKTKDGKSMMVDLGPLSQLSNQPKDGTEVSVQGVPVKVKDRVVLMARTIELDGNKIQIKRQMEKAKG